MAVSQSLSVTEVAGSQNVANNTSQVRIVWTSTQTGGSINSNTKTAYYYISVNGGAETTHSVSYTLPNGVTKTILDTIITVTHKDDGSGTVKVRTWMSTGISAGVVEKTQTTTLTPIARASKPSCITWPNSTRDVGEFGDTITIHMNKKSAKFTHIVYYSFGSLSYQWIASSVVDNTLWHIPLDLMKQLKPSDKSGSGIIIVETYTDDGKKLVGTESCEFSAKVPDIEAAKPKVTMTLDPVGALPPQFAGLYIQGLTKVKATLSANGEYGADISSYLMKVDSVLHDSDDSYTSSYLTSPGEKIVYGYATDTRGNTGETSQVINVLPYSNPRLEDASAVRCDKDGKESESGTYLKISGKRSYEPCILNGMQNNFCKIRYCYSQDRVSYSDWVTILEGDNLNADEVITEALEGDIYAEASYVVHIQAIDDMGRTADSFIAIPTDKVYMHRDGARNALGLGKYNERDNAVDSAWDFYMNGNKVTGLPKPVDSTDAMPLGSFGDYEIEHGAEGTQTYEKWASGKAVYYGKQNYGSVLCDKPWNGLYETDILTLDLPEGLFIDAPHFLNLRLLYGGAVGDIQHGSIAPTKSQITFAIKRPTIYTFTDCTVGFYVIGRWK